MATNPLSLIESIRTGLHTQVDQLCNDAITQLSPGGAPPGIKFRMPTLADGHDPRNKNGQNLTPRGAEILYRVFDDGGGYNRAAKMLGISQGAAKNRKGIWTKLGGVNRTKLVLDIDTL